jgi:hypothetical protein
MIRRLGWRLTAPNRKPRDSSKMTRQSMLASLSSLGVAIGAGLASALLFVVFARNGTMVALCLAYFAPLPLIIASLGFGQWTGLVAAILGSFVTAIRLWPSVEFIYPVAIAYAVGIGIPAWLVCAAALRGAPPLEPQTTRAAHQKVATPVVPNPAPMRALAVAALYFAAALSIAALALAAAHGGLNSALSQLTAQVAPILRELKEATSLPGGLDPDVLARILVRIIVPAMAFSGLMLTIANLWLGARIVQISARLPTPWPDIPYNLRLPVPFAAALIPAIGLIFIGHEIGFVAAIAAASLATALSLQGLAVMHDLTRGMSTRTPLLFGAYLVMSIVVPPWPMAVFTVVGLVDAALGLRERKRLRQSASPPSP